MSKKGDPISFRPSERQEFYLSNFHNQSSEIERALDLLIDKEETSYLERKAIFENMPSKQDKQSGTE